MDVCLKSLETIYHIGLDFILMLFGWMYVFVQVLSKFRWCFELKGIRAWSWGESECKSCQAEDSLRIEWWRREALTDCIRLNWYKKRGSVVSGWIHVMFNSLVAQLDYHLYFNIQRTEKYSTAMCYVMLHQLHISLFLAGEILSGSPTHLLL